VVSAENCGCQPRIGDRYVTNGSGMLLLDECTFTLCLWALPPMLPVSYVIYDRLSHGHEPNGHLFDHIRSAIRVSPAAASERCFSRSILSGLSNELHI
jgi:hypothetical protein